jgi:hypothetical protein
MLSPTSMSSLMKLARVTIVVVMVRGSMAQVQWQQMRVKDLGSGSAPRKHSFIKNSRHRKALPLNSSHTALLIFHSCKITKGTIPGPSSVLLKASAFSRNLIILSSFKCDMCRARAGRRKENFLASDSRRPGSRSKLKTAISPRPFKNRFANRTYIQSLPSFLPSFLGGEAGRASRVEQERGDLI